MTTGAPTIPIQYRYRGTQQSTPVYRQYSPYIIFEALSNSGTIILRRNSCELPR